jgi:hypothetical protein
MIKEIHLRAIGLLSRFGFAGTPALYSGMYFRIIMKSPPSIIKHPSITGNFRNYIV